MPVYWLQTGNCTDGASALDVEIPDLVSFCFRFRIKTSGVPELNETRHCEKTITFSKNANIHYTQNVPSQKEYKLVVVV